MSILNRRGHHSRTLSRRAMTIISVAGALAVGLGAGSAYAFFSGSGTGSGATVAGTVSAVTVEQATGTVSNQLQPGGTGDLLITVDNPNARALTLTSVTQNGSVTSVGGSSCTGATSGVSIPSSSGLSITIPSGTHTITVPGGVQMSSSSASGCQGASFHVPVLVTAQEG